MIYALIAHTHTQSQIACEIVASSLLARLSCYANCVWGASAMVWILMFILFFAFCSWWNHSSDGINRSTCVWVWFDCNYMYEELLWVELRLDVIAQLPSTATWFIVFCLWIYEVDLLKGWALKRRGGICGPSKSMMFICACLVCLLVDCFVGIVQLSAE